MLNTGTHVLNKTSTQILLLVLLVFCSVAIAKIGLIMGLLTIALPLLIGTVVYLLKSPTLGIYLSLVMAFISAGLARYVDGPWGLTIDIILFISFLGLVFKNTRNGAFKNANVDLVYLNIAWFVYLCLELVNPQSIGFEAWFYAMRGIGFYTLLSSVIVFIYVRNINDIDKIIKWVIALSVIGTLWGLRQNYIGIDQAEHKWLYDENHFEEHVLFGVLRVFSFYSDAGQFGASQAMISLFSVIIALGPYSSKTKLIAILIAILSLIGFGISGTRGALAVPAIGGIVYLVFAKNFRILSIGFISIIIVFYILKYTFLFQGVGPVQRMRTALDPNNPSLLVRLENQKTFHKYLADKPMGGGIGSAGFWGARFAPHTLLARTATDSWYVKIWAETGIIGISFHFFLLAYIVGRAGYIVWNLKDKKLKNKMIAIYCSVLGILGSSYGNQVFGQMPTGMIMNLFIPILFISKKIDN
jgi:hypothetical protein